MSYHPIKDIDGIGADELAVLKCNRIRTTERLLDAAKDRKGRKLLAAKTKISEQRLLRFANSADRLRIKGLGKSYSALLPAVGVDTVKELRYRKPQNLMKAMAEANKRRKLVRFLPSEKLVQRWIEEANKLDLMIKYKD